MFSIVTANYNGEKFLKIVLDVLEQNERDERLPAKSDNHDKKEKITMEELLHKYKEDFFEFKKFSSTTVLYASEAFTSLMASSMEMQLEMTKASSGTGRNEPCPCGSGKKFKKCCAR